MREKDQTPPDEDHIKEKEEKESDGEEQNENEDDFDFASVLDSLKDLMFESVSKQMEKMLQEGKVDPAFLDREEIIKMADNIIKKLNINDSSILGKLTKEQQEELFKALNKKSPFMLGIGMRIGFDGKPIFNTFGAPIKVKEKEKKEEVKPEKETLIDVYEEGDELVVVCELPGVRREDIELRASAKELEIVAKTSSDTEGILPPVQHKKIALPQEIDPDVARARYRNGILEIRLKKAEKNKKRITIE